MKELTPQEVQQALDLRRRGKAQIWKYQVSHQWLTLRITAPDLAGNFHLMCGDCERVEFDTHWQPINITIERTDDGFLVQDNIHLHVKCGLIVGEYNIQPVFGGS